jgi:cytochrome bd ubiquinol oxidase subunit I
MNTPTGFDLVDGRPVNIDPIAAMGNPAAFAQTLHMTLAAYAATGLVVAGIHALRLLSDPRNAFHRLALAVVLLVGAPAAVLQPLSGDLCARVVAHWQPTKLAAMEGQFRTAVGAPLRIGGWPDEAAAETRCRRGGAGRHAGPGPVGVGRRRTGAVPLPRLPVPDLQAPARGGLRTSFKLG